MSAVKWIKLQTDIFDNRKVKQLERLPDGDTIIVIWLKILTLAGTVNDGGLVYFTRDIPYTDQLLASEFNRPLATVQLALQTFQRFGMIEIVDELIHVSNWEKYQNIEGLDRVREQGRLRQKRWYDKQKTVPNVSLTLPNAAEKEVDKKEDVEQTEKESIPTRTRHGEYGWVLLTDDQYAKLEKDLGKDELDRCIRYVDESAQSNGNKNKWKDWNLVIRRCHREGWGRREEKRVMTFMDLGERERNDR